MSLAIDSDEVVAVLLADGWHDIVPGSFYLDSYEYVDGGSSGFGVVHNGGMGFSFTKVARDETTTGPIGSVLAVKTRIRKTR